MKVRLLKKLLKIIITICFISTFINCSDDMKILFHDVDKFNYGIPLKIEWITNQENVAPLDGGWRINHDGRQIRFDIEDSANCIVGGNPDIQSGTATATITTTETYEFTPIIEGIGELHNSFFERMDVSLNGIRIASAQSRGGNLMCNMGPVDVVEHVPSPYLLPPGTHTFDLTFTTFDPMYHDGAYYELNLIFTDD